MWKKMHVVVLVCSLVASLNALGQSSIEQEDYKLDFSNALAGNGSNGYSIAVDDDYAVVGVPEFHPDGAVYIFHRNSAGVWIEIQEFLGNYPTSVARYGESVAISGEHMMIGVSNTSTVFGSGLNSQVIWLRLNSQSGLWSPVLSSNLGGMVNVGPVAMSGQWSLYTANNNKDVRVSRLNATGGWDPFGVLHDGPYQGSAITDMAVLDGDMPAAVVGDPGYDNGPNAPKGAVHLYRFDGTSWGSPKTEQQPIYNAASNNINENSFGNSVALGFALPDLQNASDPWPVALVGAHTQDTSPPLPGNQHYFHGAMYAYHSEDPLNGAGAVSANNWTTDDEKIRASDNTFYEFFGASLDMKGNTAMVGSLADKVYQFDLSFDLTNGQLGGTYQKPILTEQFILTPSDQPTDYAKAVAVASGGEFLVGNPEDSFGSSVYVYHPTLMCNGKPVTVSIPAGDLPTSGDDVIRGTSGGDIVVAMGGDDTICGLGGNDDINGGRGDDWIDAGAGYDTVQGANDNDEIYGDIGEDTLYGGPGDDQVYGEEAGDTIYGNSGNDIIHGGTGIDRISGGSGNDTIFTGSGSNLGTTQYVTGGNGNDTMYGGSDADVIRGEAGDDTIKGAGGNDKLYGGSGEDDIDGESGNDLVRGNAGNDILRGGSGNDQVDGLGGKDVMYGGTGDDTLNGSTGNDTIFGEVGTDTLHGGGGDDYLNGGTSFTVLPFGIPGPPHIDNCDGAGGNGDTAVQCENVSNVP